MGNDGDRQTKGNYDCLLFDLDDTLYPLSSGLSANVTKNIEEYMLGKLGIGENKVRELCTSLYKYYGTTLAGLRAVGYKVDYDDFHSYVHGRLPYDTLKPDPVLRNLLLSMPLRRVVFTNADKNHAAKILNRLGLEDCFETILCFETLNDTNKGTDPIDENNVEIFDINEHSAAPDAGIELPKSPVICKPFEEAFTQVFNIASIIPNRTVFFDDSIRNLLTAKRMGLTTVWIGSSHRNEGVDYALESIHNIKEALPEIREDKEASEAVRYSENVGIETTVKA
ncbi:Haloacid dehalogenase-like hydrolase (HAD) superfamily protein [Euphorbia peplus]|nr:Haloacid dehalogenase-like hydrolase (HAD) superfamily protein [Euphorbia peplus]